MIMDNKLPKSERLNSTNDISKLFKSKNHVSYEEFTILFDHQKGINQSVKILISVPKKNHSRAVTRNKIKRLIREAYRRNKHIISKFHGYLYLGICYNSQEILHFSEIEAKIKVILQRLNDKI
ncbi:MAG: ribonuclease P protein component [Flavobacteriales bacterium]|nr:ribonuclease P protein component [Flavobacteriales bacterium]|tara:strand:+ start:1157 stop:1525 length:369 start_codon:yes stop_codon:yes gene_type:complete